MTCPLPTSLPSLKKASLAFALLCGALFLHACAAAPESAQPTAASATPRPMEAATPMPMLTPTPPAAAGELKKLANGLAYQDIVVGTGPRPLFGQKIRLHYVGRTTDGVKFDSTEGKPPFEMILGKDKVIKGWEIGVAGGAGLEPMRVGGKRKLIVPPALGYEDKPMGTLPPHSTLVFEIELFGVK